MTKQDIYIRVLEKWINLPEYTKPGNLVMYITAAEAKVLADSCHWLTYQDTVIFEGPMDIELWVMKHD